MSTDRHSPTPSEAEANYIPGDCHKPLPWRVGKYDDDPCVVDANGERVAAIVTIFPECSIPMEADDVYFIVRAVNSHEAMRASLKECAEKLDQYHWNMHEREGKCDPSKCPVVSILRRARAALKLAGGE